MFFFYFFKFITNLLQIFYFIWGDNIKYKIPSLTVDIFIFNEENEFILIKRKNDPFKGYWALPGGFVDYSFNF